MSVKKRIGRLTITVKESWTQLKKRAGEEYRETIVASEIFIDIIQRKGVTKEESDFVKKTVCGLVEDIWDSRSLRHTDVDHHDRGNRRPS